MSQPVNKTTVRPNAPMNDREFAVWEHGRIQGHAEAKREIERLRARVADLELQLSGYQDEAQYGR